MPAPVASISQVTAWKNAEMQRFAVSLVKSALALGGEDFTTDIVADDQRPESASIPGNVCTILKNANVLEPVGVTVQGVWYATRRKSERSNAKDRWLNVYRLASPEIARAFVRKNTRTPFEFATATQSEMFTTPVPYPA